MENGISDDQLKEIEKNAEIQVREDFEKALAAEDPKPEDAVKHILLLPCYRRERRKNP